MNLEEFRMLYGTRGASIIINWMCEKSPQEKDSYLIEIAKTLADNIELLMKS